MSFTYFGDMNSGYNGYSMSKRAAESYEHGSMPKSKWTKAEILSRIENKSIREKLKKCRADVLRDKLLQYDGWHHTSSYCNETNFYCFDDTYVASLTDEDIEELIATPKPKKNVEEVARYKANIYYAEWSGTRNHPKRIDKCLENVYIEERGSFFYVYDKKGKKTGKLILKKKIGSNYTSVTNLDELAKKKKAEKMKLANSSKEARKFLTNKKNHFERSMSSHLYIEGRKPSRYDYECGLENFFSIGEKRIFDVTEEGNEKYMLEFWNGKEFVSEEVWNKTQKKD